jgi:transcriptional regulator with XRE-family HTH domain
MSSRSALFPALLKYWRHHSGLSQLDLALSADVSARHVSFLETARAEPSRDMVLRLAAALRVPLRDRNVMLHAAGFAEVFAEPDLAAGLAAPVRQALERMLAQHEPYPMIVMDRRYDVQRANHGATRMIGQFLLQPSAMRTPINVFHLLFDPQQTRSFVVDWQRTAHQLLSRLQLEALARPSDAQLSQLVNTLLAYPDVPERFRQPDFSLPIEPTLGLRLRRNDLELGFLTTLTVFDAPGDVTLEELRIESYFPLDSATEQACRRLAES